MLGSRVSRCLGARLLSRSLSLFRLVPIPIPIPIPMLIFPTQWLTVA